MRLEISPLESILISPFQFLIFVVFKPISMTAPLNPWTSMMSPTSKWCSKTIKKPLMRSLMNFWAPRPTTRPRIPRPASAGKTLKTNYRQLAIYILMGTLFLIGAYVAKNLADLQILFSIMIEGLFIGGWFLMWEAFSLFFFESHETRRRKSIIKRFLDCNIYFQDTENK